MGPRVQELCAVATRAFNAGKTHLFSAVLALQVKKVKEKLKKSQLHGGHMAFLNKKSPTDEIFKPWLYNPFAPKIQC